LKKQRVNFKAAEEYVFVRGKYFSNLIVLQ